tara:strand:+ start:502 stop:645 length:144 start_codon:yes stop_codon:yes gene_type:complete
MYEICDEMIQHSGDQMYGNVMKRCVELDVSQQYYDNAQYGKALKMYY